MQLVALLAASFLHLLAWGHGLAGVVWHEGRGLVCLRVAAVAIASCGNQFSKIGHI